MCFTWDWLGSRRPHNTELTWAGRDLLQEEAKPPMQQGASTHGLSPLRALGSRQYRLSPSVWGHPWISACPAGLRVGVPATNTGFVCSSLEGRL